MAITRSEHRAGESPAPAALEVRLFGEFAARVHGSPLPRLRSRKEYRLIALLLLRHDRPLDRSWLAGTLWPDSAEPQALANLRNSLKDLRRALGAEAGRLTAPTARTLALDLVGADVDVIAFDALLAADDTASLRQAVAFYRGPLLEGWTEEWVFEERQVREGAYLAVLERLAQRAQEQGEPGEAERWLRRVIAADGLRETAHRTLMEVLAKSGRYAAAAEVYRELRLLLHRELNAAPAPATVALHERLRAEANDRGRVGGRERPQDDAHAGAALSIPRSVPGSRLPQPLTRLIGREDEVAATCVALAEARFVTLTGAGGVGKTRLAIRVAETLASEYRDGVWSVDSAPLAEPALVVGVVAEAMEVREEPERPLAATLAAFLAHTELLLVLDNCEHLAEVCAALTATLLHHSPALRILATSRQPLGFFGEVCRRVPSLTEEDAVHLFIERATAAAPDLAWTSQHRATAARICRHLDGIPLAIELAATRARALSLETIAERLDDCFRLLTGGSRMMLPRHQTLRATIDWSYNLLTEPEQALLHRLSVFAGGWTLEAAEAVCGEDDGPTTNDQQPTAQAEPSVRGSSFVVRQSEVLDLLTSLVDKSLVEYEAAEGADRYRLKETVRQYARERLKAFGEAADWRRPHLDWVVKLAERAGPELFGSEQATWLQRLEREHDNLRVALDWSLDSGAIKAGLRIGASVWRFWLLRGNRAEGREQLEALLSREEGVNGTRVRAQALDGAGVLALGVDFVAAEAHYGQMLTIGRELGDQQIQAAAINGLGHIHFLQFQDEQARPLLEQGLGLARQAEARWEVSFSLHCLGWLAVRRRDPDAARSFFEEGLAIRRDLGDKHSIVLSLVGMATVNMNKGDYSAAEAHYEEMLMLGRELGGIGLFNSLGNFGHLALRQGNYVRARSLFEEYLAMARVRGMPAPLAHALGYVARVALKQGDLETARARFLESRSIWERLGDPMGRYVLHGLGDVARYQGDLVTARSSYAASLAVWRDQRENRETKLWTARSFLKLGIVAEAQRRPKSAAWSLGGAAALREAAGLSLLPDEHLEHEQAVTALRVVLGDATFAAAWEEGRAMPRETAVAIALATSDG